MSTPYKLDETNSWTVSGVRSAERFFGAISMLVPDATHMFLEGSAAPDIVALLAPFSTNADYGAPVGTLWSWPRDQRFSVSASPVMLARLSEAAARHAEPEICSHVHFYRDGEPLVHWFDAFIDPLLVSKAVSRDRLERFCAEVDGVLSNAAG